MEHAKIIDMFGTYQPPGHYNNPMATVMVATQYVTSLPIMGNSHEDQVARQAVDLLKTVVTQQAQYS